GCKKKDPVPGYVPPPEVVEDGPDETGPVNTVATGARSELINIPYDQPLDTGGMDGLLGDRGVTLFFQPDSGLMLQIPYDSEPGPAKLTIPAIDGFELYIEITDAVLPGSTCSVIS